jgi:hypothetical protein
VDAVHRLRRDYRPAFLAHLGRPTEAGLQRASDLGRASLTAGVSLLELVQVHHEVLLEVLVTSRPDELPSLLGDAATFLAEALGPVEMARRGFLEALGRTEPPRRRDAGP